MPSSSPSERALIARIASETSWARTADRSARTAAGRHAFLDRFEREVDPDRVLDPTERARRAAHARKAYFARLALRSAQARRRVAVTPVVEAVGVRRSATDLLQDGAA